MKIGLDLVDELCNWACIGIELGLMLVLSVYCWLFRMQPMFPLALLSLLSTSFVPKLDRLLAFWLVLELSASGLLELISIWT